MGGGGGGRGILFSFLYKLKEYIKRKQNIFTETRHVMNTSEMISTDLLSDRVLIS